MRTEGCHRTYNTGEQSTKRSSGTYKPPFAVAIRLHRYRLRDFYCNLKRTLPRESSAQSRRRSLWAQRRPRDRGLLRCSFLLSLVGRGAARRTFSSGCRGSARRLPDETKWICRHLFPARCAKMSSSLQTCKSGCACVGRKSKHPCANEVRSSLFSMSSRRLRKAWRCRTSAAA